MRCAYTARFSAITVFTSVTLLGCSTNGREQKPELDAAPSIATVAKRDRDFPDKRSDEQPTGETVVRLATDLIEAVILLEAGF